MSHCATSHIVAGLILNEVFQICHLWPHYGPGIASDANEVEYLEYFILTGFRGKKRTASNHWLFVNMPLESNWFVWSPCFHRIAREYCNDGYVVTIFTVTVT